MSTKKFTDWTATIWDYDLLVRIRPYCSYLVYGDEVCPDTGKQHYQTFFQLKTPQTFEWLKEMLPKTHLEARKGPVYDPRCIDDLQEEHWGAMDYCMKDGSFVQEGQVKDRPGQGHRSDIDVFMEDAKVNDARTMCAVHSTEMKRYHRAFEYVRTVFPKTRDVPTGIHWLFGETGVGKSSYVKQTYPGFYWKDPVQPWWQGYEGEETVFVDELTPEGLPVSTLLNIGNDGVCRVPTKGGYASFTAKRLFIATNLAPQTVYAAAWQVQGPALLRRIHFYRVERTSTPLRSVLVGLRWDGVDWVKDVSYEPKEFTVNHVPKPARE